MKTLLFILISTMLFSPTAKAVDGSTPGTGRFDFRQKSDRKWGSRWTLQDWLEQRDRNRMMDLWLAMNSPSPYEFFIGGAFQDYRTINEKAQTESHYTAGAASAGAYATIIGLEGFYENNTQEKISSSAGSFNIRIVGNAVQGTHLSLNYGYRSLNTEEGATPTIINQQFAGADLNLYMTKYFGISGAYRNYFAVENDVLGNVSGNRTEAGIFIDFSAVRIFGSWYSDKQTTHPLTVETITNRTGIMSGLKFFF